MNTLTLMSAASPYVINASDLAPVMTALVSNLAVIVPFGVSIMALVLGASFIPKLVKKFGKG